jgi:hypothetical protein
MTDSQIFTIVVLGAAGTVLATIITNKYMSTPQNVPPTQPQQRGFVQYPGVTDKRAAPVAQNSPITEAAYNVGVKSHYSAGDDHLFNNSAFYTNGTDDSAEAILPI